MDQPNTPPQGQRTLAAIMFTDVVGFSTLASVDEARALRLLERDNQIVRNLCELHGAMVIKGTGDGMLVCFGSAVEAVQAAIQIQDAIAEQNKTMGTGETLKHRIGVHLGDVIVMPDDVVGDGVNVAARLQSEAKPGGIALSETVHGVVRGKVNFKATNLGPRNLKHIVETVNVWMIPPADQVEPMADRPTSVASVPNYELSPQTDDSPSGMRLLAILAAIVVCFGALTFVILRLTNPEGKDISKPTREIPDDGANLPGRALDVGPSGGTAPTADPPAQTPTPNDSATTEPSNANAVPPSTAENPVDDEISKLSADYEFDVAADQLERRPEGANQADRIARLRRISEFRRWLEGGLSRATESSPIQVVGGGGPNDKDYDVWSVGNGRYGVRLQDGTKREVSLKGFEPRELLRLTAAIFRKESASSNERANILTRARDFAIEMRLGNLPDGLQ